MYAVIFKAVINSLDEQYFTTAGSLRELAHQAYGCLNFIANSEGENEIAISYWPSLEHIKAWRQDPIHQQAMKLGKEKWYKSYQVEVVEVLRQYQG